jgi:hypothetical protein
MDLAQVNSIPNSRNVYFNLFYCNFTYDISILNCEYPLMKLDVHYEINVSFNYCFWRPSILNYLNDVNWMNIFGTSVANTCVNLFYESFSKEFWVTSSCF